MAPGIRDNGVVKSCYDAAALRILLYMMALLLNLSPKILILIFSLFVLKKIVLSNTFLI